MIICAIDLTLVAFIALPLGAIILGVTVYFFLKTQASLRETIEVTQLRSATKLKKEAPKKQKRTVSELLKRFSRKKTTPDLPDVTMISPRKISATPESVIQELKITIAQQQQVLNTYLGKVEELEDGGKGQLRQLNNDLQKEISKLHNIIEQKDH